MAMTLPVLNVTALTESGGDPVVTKYYFFGGKRVAMDREGAVQWLIGDHLGTTSLVLDADGTVHSEARHYPYGEERWSSGTLPTDYRFTGQRNDGYIKLTVMGARWYDGQLGRWISPDTIIPQPANPQSFNRFSYAYNNALRYIDPSGHDPLDEAWEEEFYRNHKRYPTDKDRRDRLFSIMHPGSGPSGSWTDADWAEYLSSDVYDNDGHYSHNRYWTRHQDWNGDEESGVSRFAKHTERLAAWYAEDEEELFVRAFAWVFGGVPYSTPVAVAGLSVAGGPSKWNPLYEGDGGWNAALNDGDGNPSHHYAGLFFAGYYLGEQAHLVNLARDYDVPEDYWLGAIAIVNAMALRAGNYTIYALHIGILGILSDRYAP